MVKTVWNWCDTGFWFGASQCCCLWAPHLPVSTQLPTHTCALRRPDAPASTFPVRHRGGRPWWKNGRWGERGSYLFPFMGTCTSAHSRVRATEGDCSWLGVQRPWGWFQEHRHLGCLSRGSAVPGATVALCLGAQQRLEACGPQPSVVVPWLWFATLFLFYVSTYAPLPFTLQTPSTFV